MWFLLTLHVLDGRSSAVSPESGMVGTSRPDSGM
jgi:hypothetical protein